MKCARCEAEGLKSRINIHGGIVLPVGCQRFYDEQGVYHSHDGSTRTENYSCSNGHSWTRSFQLQCPAAHCLWNETHKEQTVWRDPAPAEQC